MSDLGTLGGPLSYAYAINNAGEVVGMAYTNADVQHAFLYSGRVMADLGTLGGYESVAYGINNTGQVVGYATTGEAAQHAFLYCGGTMTDLNSVIDTNSGWVLEIASAINDGGQIVGVGTHQTNYARAFLLTPFPVLQISLTASNSVQLQFTAQANTGYVVEIRDSLSSGDWQPLVVLDPIETIHTVALTDPLEAGRSTRFYRVRGS